MTRDRFPAGRLAASGRDWPGYLSAFHGNRPGITEKVLAACVGDPYGWLAGAVPGSPGRVLDLACGSGPLFARLGGRGSYLGLDRARGELDVAQARGARPLLLADVARLPLAAVTLDVVVCSMALQVLQPLPGVLTESARVLRRGGVLVAMLPATAPLTVRDKWRYARLLMAVRQRRFGYPNTVTAGDLAAAGFSVVREDTRRFSFPVRTADDARTLVDSLYLPGVPERAIAHAHETASRWVGSELGVPLRRLVAVRGNLAVTSITSGGG